MGSLRDLMCGALRARREELGWNQDRVAKAVGLKKSGISAIENGTTGTYLDQLERIAAGMKAHYVVELVPDAGDQHGQVQDAMGRFRHDPKLMADLLLVVEAWPDLPTEDRELIARLCERLGRTPPGKAQVLTLPLSVGGGRPARRSAGGQKSS